MKKILSAIVLSFVILFTTKYAVKADVTNSARTVTENVEYLKNYINENGTQNGTFPTRKQIQTYDGTTLRQIAYDSSTSKFIFGYLYWLDTDEYYTVIFDYKQEDSSIYIVATMIDSTGTYYKGHSSIGVNELNNNTTLTVTKDSCTRTGNYDKIARSYMHGALRNWQTLLNIYGLSFRSIGFSNFDNSYRNNYICYINTGENGSVTPSENVIVDKTAGQTLTITPNSGYEVSDIYINGSSVSPEKGITTYTLKPTTESNVTIYFAEIPKEEPKPVNPEPKPEGANLTVKKAKYVVIESGEDPEVAYKGTTEKTKKVVIPATIKVDNITYKVTEINPNAFKKNKTATSIVVGKNVININEKAFCGASNVTTITIGSNVDYIGNKAFYQMPKLKKLIFKTSKLRKDGVDAKAYYGINNATLKVPKKMVKKYKGFFYKKGLNRNNKIK